jgi:regulatory protein
VISSITPQKKHRRRYSIFVDDDFLLGVSESVLVEYGLEIGQTVTIKAFRDINRSENYQAVRHYFLKLFGRRAHTRKELQRKSRKKDFEDTAVERVLDELEEKGWIDHDAFAQSFISDKYSLNQWGPLKIARALQQKGIDRTTAQRLTDQYFKSVDLFETFSKLVAKNSYKFNKESKQYKKRKKVFDYLHRKGYHTQQINTHIDRLMQSLDQ